MELSMSTLRSENNFLKKNSITPSKPQSDTPPINPPKKSSSHPESLFPPATSQQVPNKKELKKR
jgi:hypothetical protein